MSVSTWTPWASKPLPVLAYSTSAGWPLARVGTRCQRPSRSTRLARNPTTASRPVNHVGIGGISSSTSARSNVTNAPGSARTNAST